MTRYAEGTSVPVEKTRAEIERLVLRYEGKQFASGWLDDATAILGFKMADRHVRFQLELPDRSLPEFRRTPAGRFVRTPDEQFKAWDAACRQKWRALLLVIKAKLESVESGIETFDAAFLANTVLPDGKTAGDHTIPAIAAAYESGKMPAGLLALPEHVER